MLVQDIMNKNVITMKKHETIRTAFDLMANKNIRHIPIVDDGGNCIGILSDRDVRSAVPSIFSNQMQPKILNMPVESIMNKNVKTAHPLDFIEDVAIYFYKNRISCLPIVQGQKLVGIITETDILRVFIELTGIHQPSSKIEVLLSSRPESLQEVLKIICSFNVNILSILLYPDKKMKREHYCIPSQHHQPCTDYPNIGGT